MRRLKKMLLSSILLVFISNTAAYSQKTIPLYPDNIIPNAKESILVESIENGMYRYVTKPTLEIFLPEKGKASGDAVIICPGGAYSVLVYQGEGIATAKEFAKNGIAAFILKYRLPNDSTMIDKSVGPLQDAQQAIKFVRENASKWNIHPNKIGIMGFSAGGHLASTVATHFDKSYIDNTPETSLRPDFQILVYPVITMRNSLTHKGSQHQLLGYKPSLDLIDLFSNELHVNDNTPPAYITHAADDNVVDVDNSIGYFEELRHHEVPVELVVYPKGGHGFIFKHKDWLDPILQWMREMKLL